ncbi:MAG TPA: very short patch repair endonuclease [Verrucomicrobiae bacterium]
MSDVFTKAKRSEVMSRIRGRGNKDTELALAKLMRRNRITGWRRQIQIITSPRPSPQRGEGARVRPDFIFGQARLALFVDGCFWHGCPKHATKPKNNRAFWRRKFARNKKRDELVNRTLRKSGWRVLRVWEHELVRANEAQLVRRMLGRLTQARKSFAAQLAKNQSHQLRPPKIQITAASAMYGP